MYLFQRREYPCHPPIVQTSICVDGSGHDGGMTQTADSAYWKCPLRIGPCIGPKRGSTRNRSLKVVRWLENTLPFVDLSAT